MTAIANYSPHVGPAAKARAGKVRAVESSKARPQFDGERAGRQAQAAFFAHPAPTGAPCQYGTDPSASFWNGPRLKPAFVAQVLAQALSRPCRQDSYAQSAYRRRSVPAALLFDENF